MIIVTTFHECFIFHDCLYIFICKSTGWNPVMEPQRIISLIVALLSLIIAIRKAQRLRFLALYFLYERRLQHRRRKALARRRCVVWSYPRPQGWFEEMYRNPDMSMLWKNHFIYLFYYLFYYFATHNELQAE